MEKALFKNLLREEKDLLFRCDNALQRVLDFILRQQSEDGLWYDFQTNHSGQSNSWISGHVLWHLGRIIPRNKTQIAFQKLLKQLDCSDTGWGFTEYAPTDCDSTLNVINAFFSCDEPIPAVRKNILFVLSHQNTKGGFATFRSAERLVEYRGGSDADYVGWLNEHVCVSAIALQTINRLKMDILKDAKARLLNFLVQSQNPNGYWESYWWRSKYFATGKIVAEFLSGPSLVIKNALESGLRWIIESFHTNGYWDNGYVAGIPCIVSTVSCAKPLLSKKDQWGKVRKAVDWILRQQNSDGFWESPPIFQIPPPNLINPNVDFSWQTSKLGANSCTSDKNNIYTSSLVGGFLLEFSNRLRRRVQKRVYINGNRF